MTEAARRARSERRRRARAAKPREFFYQTFEINRSESEHDSERWFVWRPFFFGGDKGQPVTGYFATIGAARRAIDAWWTAQMPTLPKVDFGELEARVMAEAVRLKNRQERRAAERAGLKVVRRGDEIVGLKAHISAGDASFEIRVTEDDIAFHREQGLLRDL